jgi:hypothetical protein
MFYHQGCVENINKILEEATAKAALLLGMCQYMMINLF